MQLRSLLPTSAKLVLFKTAILPYLTYCQLVWHFCRASDSRKIERLQERGLRAVYKDHYATHSELLTTAQLPTLKNRRLQDDMYAPLCIHCKVKHKLCPAYISNIFNTHSTSYSLRQTDFSIPRCNTVTYMVNTLCATLDLNYGQNCLKISDL